MLDVRDKLGRYRIKVVNMIEERQREWEQRQEQEGLSAYARRRPPGNVASRDGVHCGRADSTWEALGLDCELSPAAGPSNSLSLAVPAKTWGVRKPFHLLDSQSYMGASRVKSAEPAPPLGFAAFGRFDSPPRSLLFPTSLRRPAHILRY